MGQALDKTIVGQKFGYLTVLDIYRSNSKLFCKCRCDCGKIADIYKGNVTNGHTISCGCKKNRKYLEEKIGRLIGKRFGHLVVESEYIKDNRLSYCKCKCDCGNYKEVKTFLLLNNKITHCDNCILKYEYLKGQKFGNLTIIDMYKKQSRIFCKCKCDCGKITDIYKGDILSKKITNCGCQIEKQKYQQFIGMKYGKFTVLDVIKTDKGIIYECKCDCGNIFKLTGTVLKRKNNNLQCDCSLIGKRFGNLVIKSVNRKKSVIYCTCKCDCGNVSIVQYNNLKSGHTSSCGCLLKNEEYNHILGKRFGKLIVLKELDVKDDPYGHRHFLCRCDCGNEVEVLGHNLLGNQTTSCGCKKIVRSLQRKTPITNTSGVKGVYFDQKNQKWVAKIGINYKSYKSSYDDIEAAIVNRKAMEDEYHLPIIEKLK